MTGQGTETAPVIDCDIHPVPAAPDALDRYLPARWVAHRKEYGFRLRDALMGGRSYPTATPALARRDAWPANGGPPGSDLEFMRKQHLDANGIRYGILQPLTPNGRDERNPEFGAAVCRAINDWQLAEWLEPEPRLRGSIVVPYEDADAAVAEIERCLSSGKFVQIFMAPRTREPLGSKRYWKIYEAAVANDLPIGMHAGGTNGHPISSSGWPSYYFENHFDYAVAMQVALGNLVFEGVFDRFPDLRVVLVEGGFAWASSLLWRMDSHWKRSRAEVPHVRTPPSESVRRSVWYTTQPIDEPEKPGQMDEMLDWLGWDRLLFSTDYPHWDSDDHRYAFKFRTTPEKRAAILHGNAEALFKF